MDLGFLYAILELFTQENASAVSSEQEVRGHIMGFLKCMLSPIDVSVLDFALGSSY